MLRLSQDIWGLTYMINFKDQIKGRKAFLPFVTAGDPSIEDTKRFIIKLIEAGSSIIEIGIPFSDPIAEGKTIMAADERALRDGTVTTDKIFDMVKNLRVDYPDFPFVFMTYINPVFVYGYDKFFKKCQEVGVEGLIIADLSYEEKHEVSDVASKYGVAIISLIAPTSEDRIKMIASEAEGFIYLVSSLGVTGVRDAITTDVEAIAKKIKKYAKVPVFVGFGIKNAETAKKMADVSDGAIVGSAIVNIIAEHGKDSDSYVYEFAKGIVEAINKQN